MSDTTAHSRLVALAARLKKSTDKMKSVRSASKLSQQQNEMCEKITLALTKVGQALNDAEHAIDEHLHCVAIAAENNCFKNGLNTMNNKVILPAHPTGEHLEVAKAEYLKLLEVEPIKATIAKDIGVKRQAMHTMNIRGYVTPQTAQRLSKVAKYDAIDKRKLRPDVKDEQWDMLLLEED